VTHGVFAVVEERSITAVGVVDDLIGNNDRADCTVRRDTTDRSRGDDVLDTDRLQRPQIRSIVDAMRLNPVRAAVPGEKCNRFAT